MACILNASTSSGLIESADTSGEIVLQNNGTTRLTVNSSGVTIPTLTATTIEGTIVEGTAVASTSGTSITFSSIPSWVKRVTVMFNGVSTDGTSLVQIQLGDSGGIETTGYLSSYSRVGGGGDSTGGSATSGFVLGDPASAASVRSGLFSFCNVSGNIWVGTGLIAYTNITSTGQTGGTKTLSGVLTQLRITTVNGTDEFDAGSINIQYEG
jgi:hypothetical protein